MWKVLALAAAMAVFCGISVSASEDDRIITSYVSINSEKAFESMITARMLERTPPWKESSPNPPLSARDAIKGADAVKKRLVHDTKDGKWVQSAVELRQASGDHWYWLVRYELEETGTGPTPDLILLVLMDGTVVQPKIQPERAFSGRSGRSGRLGEQKPQFWVQGGEITDKGLAHLKGWNQVDSIVLRDNTTTDVGLENLKGLTQLKGLVATSPKITDTGLAQFQELIQLEDLTLGSPRITDRGLEHLGRLANLRYLTLDDCNITDAGLRALQGLSHLESLYLRGSRITGTGLDHLQRLRQLEELNLDGARVTDSGMAGFKGLKQLQTVCLRGNQITDAGSEYLTGCKRLVDVDLRDTQVTEEGVKKLRKALPHCKSIRSPNRPDG